MAGPLAVELQHLAPQVLERVNTYLGYRAVTQLKLSRGVLPAASTAPSRRRCPPPAPRCAPSRGVDDDALREALEGLGGRARRAPRGAPLGPASGGAGCPRPRILPDSARDGIVPAIRGSVRRSAKPIEAGVLRRQALGWLGGGVAGGMALAGGSCAPLAGAAAVADDAAAPQLDDDDMILGKADAPVTMIEYASLTCPHCAHFATTTCPRSRRSWIDTGKVRWVYRDFPLDQVALQGGDARPMHAGRTAISPFVDVLFAQPGPMGDGGRSRAPR